MQSLQRTINLYKNYKDLECICYCIQTARQVAWGGGQAVPGGPGGTHRLTSGLRHSAGFVSLRTGAAHPIAPSFPQKHRDECLQPVVHKGHPVFSWCPPGGPRGHRSTWLRAWLGAGLPSLPAGQGEACAVPRQTGLGRACSSKSARLLETWARKVAAGDGQALAVSLTVPLQQNYHQLWAGS